MAELPSIVRRIDFGYFVRPAQETATGKARVEALLGYAIVHREGVLLFDSGLGEGDAEADAWYRPVRRPLEQALQSAGITVDEIHWVVNCHLHFDHCGNNPRLPGRPIFVQAIELRMARSTSNYTMPWVIDFPGVTYREVDGEVEILPGVHLIPTPGHTPGHQAVAARTDDGTIVLAGQATDSAFEYGSEQLAWRARNERGVSELDVEYLPWVEQLQQLDPRRVVFAHDRAVWEP